MVGSTVFSSDTKIRELWPRASCLNPDLLLPIPPRALYVFSSFFCALSGSQTGEDAQNPTRPILITEAQFFVGLPTSSLPNKVKDPTRVPEPPGLKETGSLPGS